MSWHQGGEVRCKSTTYAGHFVIEGRNVYDDWTACSMSLSGNARQRRRRVREIRRQGFYVTPGWVTK